MSVCGRVCVCVCVCGGSSQSAFGHRLLPSLQSLELRNRLETVRVDLFDIYNDCILNFFTRPIFTLRAKLSGAVYCYRSCLFVCVCVFACLRI